MLVESAHAGAEPAIILIGRARFASSAAVRLGSVTSPVPVRRLRRQPHVLDETSGDVSETARRAGLARSSFYELMTKLGL